MGLSDHVMASPIMGELRDEELKNDAAPSRSTAARKGDQIKYSSPEFFQLAKGHWPGPKHLRKLFRVFSSGHSVMNLKQLKTGLETMGFIISDMTTFRAFIDEVRFQTFFTCVHNFADLPLSCVRDVDISLYFS